MRFTKYDELGGQGIELADLLTIANQTGMLLARAEESGCEGCYVEVARWNDAAHQWQRFAFCKFLDGDIPTLKARTAATDYAKELNKAFKSADAGFESLIHAMPNYTSEQLIGWMFAEEPNEQA